MKRVILFFAISVLLGMIRLAAQTSVSEHFASAGLKTVNPKVGFNDMSAGAMGLLATAAPGYEEGETEDPHMSGKWIIFIDKDNEERWYPLFPDPEERPIWFVMLTFRPHSWGESIPFYFMLDGVRYGAAEDLQQPELSGVQEEVLNSLYEGENRFCIINTYEYGTTALFNVKFFDGAFYLIVAETPASEPQAVDELNGDKVVTGVRYYDMEGREKQEATDGVTIVVTTYTDGTTSVIKVRN